MANANVREARTVQQGNRDYFAQWLDRTLIERGVAGGEVARALEVNDSAVSRWRNGKATPGLDSVVSLAHLLDVNPVALAVTAGLMKANDAGMEALPMPEDTSTVRRAKEHIMKIPGLSRADREALLKTLTERYAAS